VDKALAPAASDDVSHGTYNSETISSGAGNDTIYGNDGNDILIGGSGNDFVRGGNHNDVYKFSRGFGQDIVSDNGWSNDSTSDIIEFDNTVLPTDVIVEKSVDGEHLILRVAGTEDRITIEWTINNGNYRIEQVKFADGTAWTHADLLARAVLPVGGGITINGTAAADSLTGTALTDRLFGSAGDDVLVGDSASYYQNLLVNGGFEQTGTVTGAPSFGLTSSSLPGWTKTNAGVYELVLSGIEGVPTTEGTYWLDMDGSGSAGNMVISQQVAGLTAGEQLVLRFDHANRVAATSGPFDVLWNGQVVATYNSTGTAMIQEALTVTALAGTNTVTFRGTGTVDGRGASLDNVQLHRPALVTNGTSVGKDLLDGGAGNDTLYGGGNDDNLVGGTENDILFGEAGSDSLSGDAGNDVLVGGIGNDALAGGAGDDVYRFNLGDGQDTVTDTGGIDRIEFGEGIAPADVEVRQVGATGFLLRIAGTDDRLTLVNAFGTAANAIEEIRFFDGTSWSPAQILAFASAPTAGNDTLYGTSVADVLSGGAGDDILNALGGDDQLFGDEGNDILTGDVGNDVIDGGTGNDQLLGAAGNDVYLFSLGDGSDTITDTAGVDRVEFGAGIAAANVEVRQVGTTGLVLKIAGTNDRLTLVNVVSTAGNVIEEIRFADGTSWSHAQLLAFAMVPTDGNDTLYGTSAADVMSGGAGDDALNALGGNDTLSGDSGDDGLTGDVGDDILIGGTGNDQLAGAAGNDVYRYAAGDGSDSITDTAGIDRIELGQGIAAADVRVGRQGSTNLFLEIAGQRLTLVNALNTAANTIEEVRFFDGTVWTHAQLLTFSNASTEANDTIYGTAAADSLSGGAGDDILNALGGNDQLFGEAGNDNLTGDVGDDLMVGGTGGDTMAGAAGNDTYRFTRGDGQDSITDTGGIDKIEFTDGIAPADVEVVLQGTTGLILKIANSEDRLTLVNAFSTAANAIEEVRFADGTIWTGAELNRRATMGTPRDDTYSGTANADELSGQGGRDTLLGNAGNDILSGGADNDRLEGGAGTDSLTGGTGNDILIGGTGGDTYIFSPGDGIDDIRDTGDASADTIRINGYTLGQIRFSRVGVDGNDLSIRFSGSADRLIVRSAFAGTAADTIEQFHIPASGITLTLADVLTRVTPDVAATGETLYGTSGDDVLAGGAGNDFLSGGAGADVMTGGDGDDIFGDIVADSSADTMTGGAGRDTYRYLPTFNVSSSYVEDVVTDFQPGAGGDVIRLSSSNPNPFEVGRLRVSQTGADTVILLRNDQGFDRSILRLVGVTATDLTADNFGGVPFGIDNSVRISDGEGGSVLGGGPLDDKIFGNGGADTITGLGGNDRLAGGADADLIEAGFGNDWVAGQEGHDRLLGGEGADILSGGSGDDVIYGGDTPTSANGNDIFDGGTGDDTLYGGANDDVYRFAPGEGRDLIADAGGQDRIELAAGIVPADVTVVQVGGEDIELRFGGGASRIRLDGVLKGSATKIEEVRFANGTVWTWDELLTRSMAGGTGDDSLQAVNSQGLSANLLVNGSFEDFNPTGATTETYGWQATTIPGWTDVNGAKFQLVVSGWEGVETSDGTYWLDLEGPNQNLNIAQTVSGLAAGQVLRLQFDHANRTTAASGAFEVLWNGVVVASISDQGLAIETETLMLTARDGSNILNFRGLGSINSDGASLDNVRLQAVSAQTATATLSGLAGNDRLTGSFRNDILIGGTGNDILAGGLGDDTYRFNRGDGQDSISDGDGANRVLFGADIAPTQVRVVRGKPNLMLEIVGTGDRIDLGSPAVPTMGVREVVFQDGTIWSAATLIAMAIEPGAGDDVIYGTELAETLNGGAGDDVLRGLGGDDMLDGAAGVDRLEGGDGSDTYRFGRAGGQDAIADAAGSADMLLLDAGIAPADVTVEQSRDGANLILKVKGSEARITIENALGTGRVEKIRFADGTEWAFADILQRLATTEDDVITGDGDINLLVGGLGNDILVGAGGNDVYRYARGDGRDTIRDGASSTADQLEISGYSAADIKFVRRGYGSNDVAIRFSDDADEIVLVDGLSSGFEGIEGIVLTGDGTTFTIDHIKALVLAAASTPEDDIVLGTSGSDTLQSGPGNDLVVGDAGDDVYLYRRGDGDDRIDAFGSGHDTVRLLDYNVADISSAVRAGPDSDDLVILFGTGGDRLVLRDALGSANAGGATSLAIVFKDGTTWDRAAMRARAIADIDGAGNDNAYGFDGDDQFVAKAGNDLMSGGAGSDSYVFGRGKGNDTVHDSSTASGATDTVRFLDFVSGDASVERLFRGSETVVIRFASSAGDSVTVIDALALDRKGVETYTFADGVAWTKSTLLDLLDNRAPVAADDGYFTVTTGLPLTLKAADLLRNDFDSDGDTLRIVAVEGGENGVAVFNAQGDIVYTPGGGYAGPTNLTYTIADGRNGFATAQIDVRVRPVATAFEDRGFTVAEDDFLTIRVERLLSNDLDGDRMIVGQVFGATNGTVALSSDGNISFTPAANFNGKAEFTYVANTPEGGRAEAKVYIDVTAVNDAPVAFTDGGISTLEGAAFDIDPRVLLANDRDIDGDALTVRSVQSNGDIQVSIGMDGVIRVVPRAYFWGSAYFDYAVADPSGATSTGRVNLTVTPVNDPPEAYNDRYETTQQGDPIREDNPIVISAERLLANDIERDGETLNVVAVGASHGGRARLLENATVLFEPNANFNGDAWFDYQISDGHGGTAWARATIAYVPVNDRPTARDDSYDDPAFYFLKGLEDRAIEIPIVELLKNDTDLEGFQVKFENGSNAIHGDISFTDHGTIIFTPDKDFWGEATFNYLVSDPEGAVDDAQVTLWFENVGDAPPEAVRDTIYVYEDVPTIIPISALLGNDVDIDRDPIDFLGWRHLNGLPDFFRFGSDAVGPINGTLEFNQNGDLLFTPFLNSSRSSGFVYGITDHRDGSNEGFVDIVVLASNDDPTVVDDMGFVTPLDVPLVLRVAELLFNDYDIEQADTDGDGDIDVDLDEPNRPRPRFVGVDAVLDPAQLALGNHVSVGTFEVVEFRGEKFVVIRFPEGFTGSIAIQYRIADAEGLEDIGFVQASVADIYAGLLRGTPLVDYLVGNATAETIRGFQRDDFVLAMGGNDRIETGLGFDQIDGGDGDDVVDAGDDGDTITGGAGFDTVEFNGSNTGVRADLESRVGQGGYAQGDVYIGVEALTGTDFADELGGDVAANRLEGRGGADILEGRGGSDMLIGGAGDDLLDGGAGGDSLDGGDGSDTARYFFSAAAVSISLIAGTASGGHAEGDVLTSIENLIGSDFADILVGNGAANLLNGGRGNDRLDGGDGDDMLIGGRGADALFGGAGTDIVDYALSLEGVTIDMVDGTAGAGDAEGDTFSNIEIVQGSYHDDVMRGDGGDNRLRGRLGADVIDGRGGFDTADYSLADEAVTVDLSLGQGLAGEALGDTLFSIEKLIGSDHADTLIGSDAGDVFDGGFGDDRLRGGLGSDIYLFGFDSSEDIVTELGDEADTDRIVMSSPLRPADVSLLRQDDDLFIEIENDDGFLIDTIRIEDHFLGRSTGIEEIVFANGLVWDRARIDELLRIGRFNAKNDIYRFGVEDEVAVIDPATLIRNDATEGLDKLVLLSVQNGKFGTPTIRADGMIEFAPAKDHFGDAFFDYTVRDEFGRESTGRVEVNLSPVNDAPTAVADETIYGIEDVPLRIRIDTLLANDFDVDNDVFDLRIVGISPLLNLQGGKISPYKEPEPFKEGTNATGKIDGAYLEFHARPDFFGFAGFVYTLADPDGATSTATVELYFSPVNDAPRAQDKTRSIRLETTTTITVAELMAQTYDVEGDGITFVGLHIGADGTPTSNGNAVFDPAAGTIAFTPYELGAATLKYDVIDARGAQATLTYKLKVRPLNDAPIARNDYGLRTLEDQILVIDPASLLANDYDENGDTLILTGVERFPTNGKVRINAAGMIEFSPRTDYNGNAGFEYYISDGRGGTAKAFVSITVMPRNAGPILEDDIVKGLEDQPLYVIPAEAFGNDIEPDGDVLFFKRASVLGVLEKSYLSAGVEISAKMADGTALPSWLSFDSETIGFRGTMPAGQTEIVVDVWVHDPETDSTFNRRFTFEADDLAPGASRHEEVLGGYIIRQAWSDGLEFGAASLGAGVSVTAALAGGTALPSWLTFDSSTLRFTGTPPEGESAPFDVALTFTYLAEGAAAPVSLVETLSIDPAQMVGGIAYDSDTALFDISQGHFSASLASGRPLPDWLAFDPATMTVSLTGFEPDADAPLARLQIIFTQDPQTLPEKTYASSDGGFTLEFVIDPRAPLDPAINALLHNNPFFAAQGLFAVDLGAAAAIVAQKESRAPLPSWLSFNSETLTFSGMPPANFVGAMPVRLNVTGNGSTLPTLSIITDAVVDTTYKVVKNDALSVTTGPERIDLNAPVDFNGAVAISYDATDEKGGISAKPAIIVFNVTPTPEKPDGGADEVDVLENGSVTVALADLLRNDFDRDGHSVRAIEVKQPAHGAVTVNLATAVLGPPASLAPVAGAIWSVTLANGSALPSWMSIDPATGLVTATVPLDVLGSYALKFTMTDGATAQSASASFALDGNAGVTLTYVPTPSYSGDDLFSYVITDDKQGTGTAKVNVHVAPVADPPYPGTDTVIAIEDTALVIDPAALLANDIDVDGDPISFVGVLNAVHGTVSFDGVNILFTPDHNFDGRATFEYIVTDNVHGSSVGLVNVDVQSTNRAPVAVADRFATVEDTPFEFTIDDLLANDSDPDGDTIRFVSLTSTVSGGRILELPGGRYQFVADENVYGTKSFSYTITDGRRTSSAVFSFDIAPVNDAPIANPDGIFTGDQDTPLVINFADLIANDRDVEGDLFALYEVFDGDNGEVVRVGDTAVFTGREGYYGNAAFSYRVTDQHGATSVGRVSLTIRPDFEIPIAVSDAGYEVLEDSYIDLDPAVLMANDFAPEGTTLTFLGFAGGATLLDNGLYRVAPAHDFFGRLVLTYSISNGSDFQVPTTVTIDVLPVSDNPVAVNDSLATVEDTPLTIFTTQILANDHDVDRQAIVLSRIVAAQGVSVVDNGIGQLIITPDRDFAGDAWFEYEIEDSSGITAKARVAVAVEGVNDAPAIAAIPVQKGLEDTAFSAVFPASLVTDADGDALVVEMRGVGGTALPAWLSYDQLTRTLSGTPPLNFNGNVVVELAADDGKVETVRQVVIAIAPVNDAPQLDHALADKVFAEDSAISIVLPANAFSDLDGDSLSYSARLAGGDPLPSWLSFAGGALTGTPPANFNGILDIEVVASDGQPSVSDVFRLTIDPVNDAPTVERAIGDAHSAEDTAIDLAIPADTFADVDGDALTLTARLASGDPLPGWLSFDGSRFTGTPPADFNGFVDLEVVASDGLLSASSTFRLTIDAVNDGPVLALAIEDAAVAEDNAIDLLLPAGTFADVDGDALTLTAKLANGDALPSWLTFADGRFTGTPPVNYNGILDIEVTASDGALTVSDTFSLTVDPVNDRPTLEAALADVTSPEDMAIDVTVPAGTFADLDGDSLTLTARLANGNALPGWLSFDGARFTGTPPANFHGGYDIEVTASDGALTASDIFRLTVSAVNDPPVTFSPLADVSVDEDHAVDILLPTDTFADIDGDVLTLTARLANGDPLPSWLSFAEGRFTGTPPANFNGILDIEVMASDGALIASDVFRLTIDPVNDRPTLEAALADATSPEDAAIDVAIPAGTFADVDRDSLTLTARLANGDALPGWLSFDGTRFTGNPPADYNGTLDIEVTASDGSLTVGDIFRLTVSAVNDAPVLLAPIADAAIDEDMAIDLLLPAGTFGDVDGDSLTLSARLANGEALPSWLSFTGGRFTGTPPANFNGILDIEVTASDGALIASDVFRLSVLAVNDAPTLQRALADVHSPEDSAINLALPADTFADLDGDTLTLAARLANGDALPGWLSFDGARFTGTPPANYHGSLDIQVTASDGALTVSDAFRLTVDPVNDRPTLVALLADVIGLEDVAIDVTIPAGTFADVDGDSLALSARLANGNALPSWLSFAAGRLTGTPPTNFNGFLDIEILASDGALAVADVFRLVIAPVNDPPVVLIPIADAAVAEDRAVDILLPAGTFADAEGDALALTAKLAGGAALPSWLNFASGRFTGNPPADYNGTLDIEVTASDGALTVSDIFRLSVIAVNDAPTVMLALANAHSPEDTTIDLSIPAGTFADVDGDALTLTARLANGTALPSWLSFDGARFTGTPPANFHGFIDLQVFASDGLLSTSSTFRLTVSPVNDVPTLVQAIADISVAEETAVNYLVPANSFADVDGDALTLSATLADGSALPVWLSFTGGRLVGTPPLNMNGTLSIRVSASDGLASASDVFTLTVTPVNDAPVVAVPFADANLPEEIAIDLAVPAGTFYDVDGNTLSLTATLASGAALPSWLIFANGRFTGTPPANFTGAFDIRVTASDGALTASDTFKLTIYSTNDAPVAVNDETFMVTSGVQLTIAAAELLANDFDPDGDALSLVSITNASHGLVQLGSGGVILYTADLNYVGFDTFQYSITDGRETATATVTIKVSDPFAGWQQGTAGKDNLKGNMSAANNIFAGAGDDHVKGGKFADGLAGGDGDDHIQGMQGDDILYGMAGNDNLNGGDGFDTAVLAGDRSTYVLTTSNGELRLTDLDAVANGNDGTDTLVGIERLSFRGGETLSISSPIVLDLDGDGTELLASSETNAAFDMDGDGKPDDTSWFGAGDAILFLDRDGNGTVTDAKEFSFTQDVANARSDLEGLAAYDSNKDGKLTSADARFGDFRLWQDRNGDGVAATSEITTLAVSKIAAISLTGAPTSTTANPGSAVVINSGSFTKSDGGTGVFADAAFTYFSGTPAARAVAITMARQSFAKKSDKYQIVAEGGQLFVSLKKAKGTLDPSAGRIGPATLISFRGSTFGMLAPIVLDLDGDGIELKDRKDSKASFDMDGDGVRDDTGWIGKGDGLLVVDRNGDGLITTSAELSFLAEKPDAGSDLEALAVFDSNRDRKIDATDLRFGELKVWVDGNRNGITDGGELRSLAEMGIASISLDAAANRQTAKPGDNLLVATGTFTLADGTVRSLGDAALAFKPSGGGGAAAPLAAARSGGPQLPPSFDEDDRVLTRLTTSLRAGLDDGFEVGSPFALPSGADPFEFFAPSSAAAQADSTVQHTQNLPKEALPPEMADSFGTGGLVTADRRVALMAQDMAGFGGFGRESVRLERHQEGLRLDYFA